MKTSTVHRLVKTAMAACLLIPASSFVQASTYSQIVAQARADLNAGHTAQALTESQKAIAANPVGWQAYVVAGSALRVKRQYDKAIDDFTKALEYAPDAKKAAVRGLLEKCMKAQIASQSAPVSVTPVSSSPLAATKPSPVGIAASDGPSYNDTVQWIQAHVKDAGTPGSKHTRPADCSGILRTTGQCSPGAPDDTTVTDPQTYSASISGCDSITVTMRNGGMHKTYYGFSQPHQDGEVEGEHTSNFGASTQTVTLPFRAVASFSADDKFGYVIVTAAASGIRDETDFPDSSNPAEQVVYPAHLMTQAQLDDMDASKPFYFGSSWKRVGESWSLFAQI